MDPNLIAQARDSIIRTNWRIQLTIPSVLAADEPFMLRLTAFAPDGLPSAEFQHEIVLADSVGVVGLPKSVRLDANGDGSMAIDGLRAVGPDHAVVVATFERSLLDVRIGDLTMGRAAVIDRGDPLRRSREIRVAFLASRRRGPHHQIVLLRNGEEIQRMPWDPERPHAAFRDDDPLDQIAIRDATWRPDPFVVYYARVEDKFDETQWSSPIWLDL